MAKNRRARRREISELDKKRKVSVGALKQAMGIFKYVLPYQRSFWLGMLFLLLSTGTTLMLPFFLGELVNSAVPGSAFEQVIGGLELKLQKGETIEESDIQALKNAQEGDYDIVARNLEILEQKFQAGETITSTDIQKLSNSEDSRKAQAFEEIVASSRINEIAFILGLILLSQAAFSFMRVYLFAQVSERAMADIRYGLYQKIITLPLIFFEQRRVGELTSRISSDVTQLQDMLSITMAEFLRQILTLVVGIGVLVIVVSWELTVFMVLTFPLLIIATIIFGRFIRRLSKKAQDQLADSNTIVEETFQSISIVKAFANELLESMRYRKALDKVVRTALKAATFRGGFVSFLLMALFGGIILVIWRGAHMVAAGSIEIGDLFSFVIYTVFIGGSVAGMGDLYGQLQKTLGASERVREILEEESEFKLPDSTDIQYPPFNGKIRFEDVEFTYPARKDVKVLKGVNLEVNPGEKIALVGHSGAGKSTIAQLILRFYEIEGGAIYIDQKTLAQYKLPHLRNNMGVVPQEVILFGGTIRENIAYGKPDATNEEVITAAKRANAWEFISDFPDQLETLVGERGIKLSGGQRQRVAIARAILKDPAILILDEATSSLDAESEQLVQSALNELMKGRTTLIIAHRLSTIRNVDCIYVLDQGRIIESGTHEELSTKPNGTYSSLLRMQLEVG